MPQETELLYLKDTYAFEGKAHVVRTGVDEKRGFYVVLDQTLFYPQGGGQPSDKGALVLGDIAYEVSFVGFVDGEVWHHLKETTATITTGQEAFMKVDGEQRLIHARAHTAGHLLDAVSRRLAPELIGRKGYHFLEGPYVEFEGTLTTLKQEDFTNQLNEAMEKAIKADLPTDKTLKDPSFLESLTLPAGFSVPAGKPCRVVSIEGLSTVPCGGTHIKSLSELKEVKVKKVQIQAAKNTTKVSYTFCSSHVS